ncbi:MAG: hypothetical protein ABSC06_00340 [Rhodopila sp.]
MSGDHNQGWPGSIGNAVKAIASLYHAATLHATAWFHPPSALRKAQSQQGAVP